MALYGLVLADFIFCQCSPATNTLEILNFIFFKYALFFVAQVFTSAPSAWITSTLLCLPFCCFSSI